MGERCMCCSVKRMRICSISRRPFHSSASLPTACFYSMRHVSRPNQEFSTKLRTSSSSTGWKQRYLEGLIGGGRGVRMRREAGKEEEKMEDKGYKPMERKPRWWMRLLACYPYLLTIHVCWVFSETAYSMHPFLEDFEFITYPFLCNGLGSLPGWFFTAYFIVGYLGIVQSNKVPHFLRFHILNGMLLEILFSICGQLYDWMPKAFYWGLFGQHFWFYVSVAFLWTGLFCIGCALTGCYADVPFISDSAYMLVPY